MNRLDYELGGIFLIVVSAFILYTQLLALRVIWVAMFFGLLLYGGIIAFALVAVVRQFGTASQIHSYRVLTIPLIYIVRSRIVTILSRMKKFFSHDSNNA
jgi:hypothetical protein